jgi:hypothetical protein
MLHWHINSFIAVAGLILCFAMPVSGQIQTGAVFGIVTDIETHEPLSGVSVGIVDAQKGGIADEQGKYRVNEVAPGIYNIRFSLMGYRSLVKTGIDVKPGRDTELLVELSASPVEMEAVTVTAEETYFEAAPEAEVSGRTIDSREIATAAGGLNDIQRVVQALPSVTTGSDMMNEIIVRGGNYNENLFVMDGIEIPNPNHFAFQNTGGGIIPLLRTEFIKDVTFLAGAFPARYGDKASSVMDISLRNGSRDRYLTALDMSIGGAGFMAEGPVGKNGSFLLSGRRSYLDLATIGSDAQVVPIYHNMQGKLTYTLGRHNILWNTVVGADRIKIEEEEEDASSGEESDENVYYSTDLLVNGLTVRSVLTSSLYSELVLSDVRNSWKADVWEDAGAATRDLFNNRSKESETTLRYNISWFVGPHELAGGFSVKNSRFDHNIFADGDTVYTYEPNPLSPDDPEQDTETGVFLVYDDWRDRKDVSTYKNAAFLQARIKPIDRLTLRLGTRYDLFEYIDESRVSPRIGLRYQLGRNLYLNGAYGIHYQSPSYLELTANPANRENLSSYKTEQVVIGTEWFPAPDLRLTVEGYKKAYRDVPVERSWTTPDPWDSSDGELINKAKGHAEGIEFYLQKKMSASYQYIFSYSYYRAFFTDPRFNEERPWDFDHRNLFTVSGTKSWRLEDKEWYKKLKENKWYKYSLWFLPWPFGDEVLLSGRWRFAGGRPYTRQMYLREYHTWIESETTPMNTERFSDYHRLDIRLDRKYYRKNWSFSLYIDVMNVYGRKNIWDYSYDEYGKKEKINQFMTLPISGIIVEF